MAGKLDHLRHFVSCASVLGEKGISDVMKLWTKLGAFGRHNVPFWPIKRIVDLSETGAGVKI